MGENEKVRFNLLFYSDQTKFMSYAGNNQNNKNLFVYSPLMLVR